MGNILDEKFYETNAYDLAKLLLGKVLCRKVNGKILKGRIVETECYMGLIDDACHSFHGKLTRRTEPFYYNGGVSYVYLIYGMYNCFNVVANDKEHPEAVLIRAIEPMENINIMIKNRYPKDNYTIDDIPKRKLMNLTNGPGKLSKALNITTLDNLLVLSKENSIYIEDDNFTNFKIVESKRIGIDYAKESKDKLWRFNILDNPYVSRR